MRFKIVALVLVLSMFFLAGCVVVPPGHGRPRHRHPRPRYVVKPVKPPIIIVKPHRHKVFRAY